VTGCVALDDKLEAETKEVQDCIDGYLTRIKEP